MGLKEIELQKFKEGFNQFSAQEIRELFEYVKNLRYNSSAAAPLQMDNTPNGMALSIQQDVGVLAKAKANIADGATGKVVLTDLLFAEIGDEFDAKNFTGSAVTNGDTKLQVGRDPSGAFFFRKTESPAPVICDCQDLSTILECWDFGWLQDLTGGGSIGGTFSIAMTWTLTDLGGTPLTGCNDIAKKLNCEDPCDLAWLLAPQAFTETMEKFPFDGLGNDHVDLTTPWGDIVSYGFGFDPSNFIIINADCGDTSVDLLSIGPVPPAGCPDPTGESAPCIVGDPRPECVIACP